LAQQLRENMLRHQCNRITLAARTVEQEGDLTEDGGGSFEDSRSRWIGRRGMRMLSRHQGV